MHGVEVRQHENSAVGRSPAGACDQVIAEPIAAGYALEPGAGALVGVLDMIDHAVDGLGNRGRALDLDPAADLGQHVSRVEFRFSHSIPLALRAYVALAISLMADRMAATTWFWPRVNCVW